MKRNKKFSISLPSLIAGIISGFSFRKQTNRHSLHIPPGELDAGNVFWLLTIYEIRDSLFTATIVNRYLINPNMEPQLQKDVDGGITLFIQNESPGKRKETNWLPAPKGNFWMALRLWHEEEEIKGIWWEPQRAVKGNKQ
jgi:hypothetical protein